MRDASGEVDNSKNWPRREGEVPKECAAHSVKDWAGQDAAARANGSEDADDDRGLLDIGKGIDARGRREGSAITNASHKSGLRRNLGLRLEEIKEFSKHQQEFADKIMDLLGEGKASNYAKVCRLATYMSTVPTSPEVRAGWKEFLGDMTVLLKLAEKKQVDAANASKVDSLSVVKGNGLSNSEKLELEELHVLKAHKPVLSADRMERLQELEAKALEIPVIQVPDDLYGNISRRAHRQQMRAQSQLVPMLDMINLPEAQGDDT